MTAGDVRKYYDDVYYKRSAAAPVTTPYDPEMPLLKALSISTFTTMMSRILGFWGVRGGKMLDVGCGVGLFLDQAAGRGVDPYGVDFSLTGLKEASRRSPRARLLCGAAEELPFLDNVFDHVSHIGSLEHYSDPAKAVVESLRVAKPTATFMIVLPNTYFWGACLSNIGSGLPPEKRRRHSEQIIELTLSFNEWSHWLEEQQLHVIHFQAVPLPLNQNGYEYDSLRSVVVDHFVPLSLAWQFAFHCRSGAATDGPNPIIEEPATGRDGLLLLEQVIADINRWILDHPDLPGIEVVEDGIEFIRYLGRYLRLDPGFSLQKG